MSDENPYGVEDSDSEVDEKGTEMAKKITQPRDVHYQVMFQPNVINHFVREEDGDLNFYGQFGYNLTESQYVIANSDQVKVRYIVQVQKVVIQDGDSDSD